MVKQQSWASSCSARLCRSIVRTYLETQTKYDWVGYYSHSRAKRLTTRFYDLNNSQTPMRVVSQNVYTYDDAGQRTANQITDNWNNTRTENYTYDEQFRLKTVNYGDGQTQGYAFDAMGNRTAKTDTVGGSTTSEGYAFDNANRLISRTVGASTGTYTNNANGNITG